MASEKKVAPYGTWESPISTDLITGSSNTFSGVYVDAKSETIYLIEGRAAEDGRGALVRFKDQESSNVLPKEYSVGSKVHEYGGGAAAMSPDGSLIFSDSKSSGVFRLISSRDIEPITEANEKLRYADFDAHPKGEKWILAVQEDHRTDEVLNQVVVIDSVSHETRVIASGADFYGHPKFSHDGKWVSWIQWRHPDMPWTGNELYVAEWKDGTIGEPKLVAGKAGTEATCQPQWHSYGGLMFGSDKTGFQQLYLYDPVSSETRLIPVRGFDSVDLVNSAGSGLGSCTYIELNPATLVVTYTRNTMTGLLVVGISSDHVVELDLGLIDIRRCAVRRVSDTKFVVIGAESTSPNALYLVDIKKPKEKLLLRSSASIPLDPTIYSTPQHISFPRTRGKYLEGFSHAMFTLPYNPSYSGPSHTKPPLIVNIHGGPSMNAPSGLNLTTQFWTSRGYAYVHVNHAGSTGYGRAYRESLDSFWGIKDVDDAASCVDYLSSQGLVDGTKVGITGESAGGYTTLNSLVTYPTLYAAGNSLYGIGNLKLLASGTHKFESHFLFGLIFTSNATEEEKEKIYWERSPRNHAAKIERPLLLLQGGDDGVVPLDQSIEMEKILKQGGKDATLIVFEGEGHGFKKQESNKIATEEEEKLWRRTLLV